ncbi:hypothetical protein ACG2OD_32175 [Streptomyces sp. PDY-4]|uniref:Uncharacterized protein n=1 Tax=Streptomyces fungicidicus TaxID=68203 RepID=A0A494UWJ0_9ACTN|nr:hypothetical protein [Streptomyces fungicidicus]AYL34831.1 hypothetical protein CNQ36_04965 [Streptomyces fungicidicus]
MTRDPIRSMRDRQNERKRALADGHYARALMDRKAPSVAAFITALDAGHEGEAALDAARGIDQAAATFLSNQQPTNDTPPAA